MSKRPVEEIEEEQELQQVEIPKLEKEKAHEPTKEQTTQARTITGRAFNNELLYIDVLEKSNNTESQEESINKINNKIEALRSKIKEIITLNDLDLKTKITQLKQIEDMEYKPLIRQLAYKKTPEELKALVALLQDLGDLSIYIGNYSTDTSYLDITGLNTKFKDIVHEYATEISPIKYYTDAAIFYQYAITIIQEKIDPNQTDKSWIKQVEELYVELANTKKKILLISRSETANDDKTLSIKEEITENKKILSDLRDDSQEMLRIVENYQSLSNEADDTAEKQEYEDLYVNESRQLFEVIAHNMRDFLAKLYIDSEKEVGEPPCSYAVMGLGSMALNQMTPYSDLEFAILTANEDYKRSSDLKVKEYFKNLSHLVHFKIINLGETIIPTSKYGLGMSHLVHRGVNFDLGGKTPLGRIDHDKPYELIQTVAGMLKYVHNEGDKASHIDKTLPYILEKVSYVYGDKKLLIDYQTRVTTFLHSKSEGDSEGRLNCEARALKVLKEGVVELDYLKPDKPGILVDGNLYTFNPSLSKNNGRLFDVKQEIYRLADRLIHDFGMCYGIEGNSAWDSVDQLQEKGIIGGEAANHLKYAVTFATNLRLKTYFHHKAQQESISIFAGHLEGGSETREQVSKIFHLDEEELRETGGLFEYFYTALPLHKRLEEFCDNYKECNITKFFREDRFYVDSYKNKGLIYYRLLQYQEAQQNLEKALNENSPEMHLALGSIYSIFGKYDEALTQFKTLLNYVNTTTDNKYSKVHHAFLKQNIATVYVAAGKYNEALDILQECAKIFSEYWTGGNHIIIATNVYNIAKCYFGLNDLKKARQGFEMSMGMLKAIGEHLTYIADCTDMLGMIAYKQQDYKRSIEHYKESLSILNSFYKGQPHLDIATSLTNLAGSYRADGDYDKAQDVSMRSLKMKQYIYGGCDNQSIALSLVSVGNAYAQVAPDLALSSYIDAKKMLERLPICSSNKQHLDKIFSCLYKLGNQYAMQSKYDKAIECYTQSLDIKKDASVFKNLGNCYAIQEKYNDAITCYTRSLNIQPKNESVIKLLGKCYAYKHSLDPQKIALKILNWAVQGKDFTDNKLHYDRALSLESNSSNKVNQLHEIIEEYRLALIFTSEIELATKTEIHDNLSKLLGIDPQSLKLWLAAMDDNTGQVKELVSTNTGVSIDISIQNRTPLIQAIIKGNEEMLSILVLAQADVNKSDEHLTSPLYYSLGFAGQPVRLKITEFLLQNKADPNQAMDDGDTPIHMAHYKGDIEAIMLLLQYGAKLNVQNLEGKTPLHCLLASENVTIATKIKIIIEFKNRYDITIQDKDGKTAIDYAQKHCPETLSLFSCDKYDNDEAHVIDVRVDVDDLALIHINFHFSDNYDTL